jgi:two-component system sensor kinase FixL
VEPFVSAAHAGKAGIAEDVPLKFSASGFEETRYYTFSYTPIRGPNGPVLGFTTLCTDTTEKVEAVMRVAEERNSTFRLFEEAPGFVAMTQGREHRFTFANAAYLKLVGREQVVGRTVDEVLPEVRDQEIVAILDGVFESGRRFVASELIVELGHKGTPERSQHYLTFVFEPMRGDDGRVCGIFLQGHDVTERVVAQAQVRRLQSELIHASRFTAMGAMAATLAHELNQPLAAISNYLSASQLLLQRGVTSGVPEALASALNDTSRAGQIIGSMREFTRRGEVKNERVKLSEAIREAGALVESGAAEGVKISYSISDHLEVVGDPIQIQQVVLNLLRNACDASDEATHKQVEISSDVVNGMARVCVDDHGTGLDPAQLDTLFDAFRSSKLGGLGVGLAISRTITEAHGGAIWAENIPGGGARFCFTLPLASS